MVKVIYRGSENDSALTDEAKKYIKPIICDALMDNAYLDVAQLADILIGELEENNIIEAGCTHKLASEIRASIRKMRSKYV